MPESRFFFAPQIVEHVFIGLQQRLGLLVGALSGFGEFERTLVAQEKGRADFGLDRLERPARRTRFAPETVARRMTAARAHDFTKHPPNAEILRSSHDFLSFKPWDYPEYIA